MHCLWRAPPPPPPRPLCRLSKENTQKKSFLKAWWNQADVLSCGPNTALPLIPLNDTFRCKQHECGPKLIFKGKKTCATSTMYYIMCCTTAVKYGRSFEVSSFVILPLFLSLLLFFVLFFRNRSGSLLWPRRKR